MSVKARCYLALLSLLLLCQAGTASAQTAPPEHPGQVWQVGAKRWNDAAEQRFATWVEQTITEDFFLHHRIPVDCADVPYAIRWIYARMAHLPAAATLGDGGLIGHWSTDWGQLPTHREWHRDERFRAALSRMLAATSTRTLPDDTYPIRITPDSLRPGALFLIAASHAGMIGRIVHDGSTIHPIQIWEATLPRKIRKISEREFFATTPDPDTGSGLTRFRWPVFRHGRWQYCRLRSILTMQWSSTFLVFAGRVNNLTRQWPARLAPRPVPPRTGRKNSSRPSGAALKIGFPSSWKGMIVARMADVRKGRFSGRCTAPPGGTAGLLC